MYLIGGLAQDCSNSIANTLELLQSCVKLLKWYRQIYNISHTLIDNNIVDHSDVVGASPAGAAPTASSFLT